MLSKQQLTITNLKIVSRHNTTEYHDMKNFKTYLAESSLSRIMHHIEKTENFGVISPFRKGIGDEKNLDRYKELRELVREKGYGFIELKGGYQEETGFVNEKSLFIPKIKKEEMIELGKKYDQHSVIIKDKNMFAMIGTSKKDGNVNKVLMTYDISGKKISVEVPIKNVFDDFFSKLLKGSHSGKRFQFKMQEKVETSMYYHQKYGEQWLTIIEDNG